MRPRLLPLLPWIASGCVPGLPAPDAGHVVDAGAPDAGAPDAGALDTGVPDAGAEDGGAPDAGPGGWTDLPAIAAGPRQEAAVVAVDGVIYVVGGYDDGGSFHDSLLAYDIAAGAWSARAPLPLSVHHPNVAVYDGRIYVLGFLSTGFVADGATFVYDPALDQWTTLAPLPGGTQRGGAVTGVVGERIIVAGGLRGAAVVDVSAYDVAADSWTARAPLPEPLDHAFGGAVDDKLVVAGGRNTSIAALSDNVYVYDAANDTWLDGAAMPTARGGGASAVVGQTLYTLGGEGAPNGSGVFDAVEAYDVGLDSWASLGPMPVPRHGMGAAAWAGAVYVPGGADVQAFAALAVFDVFVP